MQEKALDRWSAPAGLKQIEAWAEQGLINAEIAELMGIEPEALDDWLLRRPDITDTLKRARTRKGISLLVEIKSKLYRAAVGYDIPDEQTFKTKRIYWDKQGRKCEAEEIRRHEVMKPHPADPVAMIYWLEHFGSLPELSKPKKDAKTE